MRVSDLERDDFDVSAHASGECSLFGDILCLLCILLDFSCDRRVGCIDLRVGGGGLVPHLPMIKVSACR